MHENPQHTHLGKMQTQTLLRPPNAPRPTKPHNPHPTQSEPWKPVYENLHFNDLFVVSTELSDRMTDTLGRLFDLLRSVEPELLDIYNYVGVCMGCDRCCVGAVQDPGQLGTSSLWGRWVLLEGEASHGGHCAHAGCKPLAAQLPADACAPRTVPPQLQYGLLGKVRYIESKLAMSEQQFCKLAYAVGLAHPSSEWDTLGGLGALGSRASLPGAMNCR